MSPNRFSVILWKEWKGLQPFCILLVILFVIGLILVQVTEFMDEQPIWESLLKDANYTTFVTFVLCVIVCTGLLTREKDEGHIHFLDGLPVTRFSIYLAKSLLAFVLVAVIDLIWTGESLVYEFLSRESNSPPTPWAHVGTFVLINTFLCGFFIAILLPLSFLRLWSLLVLGTIFWLLVILKAQGFPFAVWLDPFELMQPPTSVDDPWVIPWKHMAVLAVIGGQAWLAGLYVFTRRTRSGGLLRDLRQSWLGKLAAFGSVVLIIGIWLSLYVYFALREISSGNLEAEPVTGAEIRPAPEGGSRIGVRETGKFEFIFREKAAPEVARLAGGADEVFETVAAFLLADESATSGKTRVDLSNPVGSHNAGQAYWKKIRMVLPPNDDGNEARAILGHELTHVLAERITGGRLEETFDATRWFHEGLASHVEFEFFREPEEASDFEHWAALASCWGEIEFGELVSSSVLSRSRDPHLVYPAGMIWVRAAIDIYGEDCPAHLLRAIGREDGPRKLLGLARWRDACLAAGYDLERIRARFRTRLRELREKHRDICENHPEIRATSAARSDGSIVITPDLPEGFEETADASYLVCRVRPDEEASPGQWRYSKLNEDEKFRVSGLHFLQPKIDCQIGWKIEGWSRQPIFGEWVTLTIE